jgi:hypothetical protein
MTLEQLLQEIESHEFSARLNVASSMQALFANARKEPSVIALYQHMRKSGEACEEVLSVIQDLSHLAVDPRYENPHDTSLAVLLWLTSSAAPDYTYLSADLIDHAPQCWYSKKLARAILLPPPVATGDVWVGERPRRPEAASDYSGSIMMYMSPMARGAKGIYHESTSMSSSTVVRDITESVHQWRGETS